jgi:hypothetical protein
MLEAVCAGLDLMQHSLASLTFDVLAGVLAEPRLFRRHEEGTHSAGCFLRF